MLPTRIALALTLLSPLAACDNEVELLSDDPGVPVVYGLIDGSSDAQLLSVTRSFRFSDGGDALQSAADPDSVYYSAEELSLGALNLRTGLRTDLERVDLVGEGNVVREAGLFPTSPNVAYRWSLRDIEGEPGDSIAIEGLLPGGRSLALGGVLLKSLDLRRNGPLPIQYNLLADTRTTPFRWSRGGEGAEIAVLEIGLNVAFSESGPGGTRDRVLYYPLELNLALESDRNSVNVDNQRFNGLYGFLADRLVASPDITRSFQYAQAVITGADSSYLEFQTLLRANSGITATQELPPFSNVDGGLGLVAVVTRLLQAPEGRLSNESLDSLRAGALTRDLNFQ